MYVKIPADLKEPLLKELRRYRFKSILKYYPVSVLIFSAVGALFVFEKGDEFIWIFHKDLPTGFSTRKLSFVVLSTIVIVTAGLFLLMLRQHYRDCECQELFFCPNCDAVDRFDSGKCPICGIPLTEKAGVFFTTDKGEKKIIERWGLQPSQYAKEQPLPLESTFKDAKHG